MKNLIYHWGFVALLVLCGFNSCTTANKGVEPLERAKPSEALNVAMEKYLQSAKEQNLNIQSVMVLQHGKVLYEKWMNGGEPQKPHVLNSVSKTFTSAAVGLAISEGLLSLDDKLVSFFPEDLPEAPSENLNKITIHNLLTMNCGHDSEPSRKDTTATWVKTFLAWPVEHEPGTYYCYNSMGTYMLSAIVQKVTGQKIVDYLQPRLFNPLGIEAPHWDESPQGINCGGWGLYLKTEDLAKMGQLLLQKGKWNGKQVLPEKYVTEATRAQVPCQPSWIRADEVAESGLTLENSDWVQGYGYQVWRCRHNAYRADGAGGQYIIVIPEKDVVIINTADLQDMQAELNLVWDNILPALDATDTGNEQEIIMTNPLNLSYKFEMRDPVHRTAADPVIVLYHDKYFLFSSHAAGYSYSDNLRDWTHMFSKMPLVKEWAPAVMVYDDYIYYMGFGNKKVYRTKDPIGDNWEEVVGSELPDKGDPDFFIDNDGRTYYLWGCSAGGPMQGQEFDPKTFKPISEVVDLMPYNGKRLGWEVPGNHNEKVNENGWNEGVSMVHEGDYYYFFYATPGTEYTTYCTGGYVGKSPLGPFEPMVGSPHAIRPAGFFTGGGHGHPFVDRYGNHWYVASLIIGTREHYERRIGIFPAYYNEGYAHTNMDGFDKPFVVPNRKVDFEKESILLDMNVLSTGKTMTASSSRNDMTPNKASDDNIRSWWSAQTGNEGEWLQMDLGRAMSVEGIQVCFADEGFKSYRYDTNVPVYQYVVEGSKDGKKWHTILDRTNNMKDQIYELFMLPKADQIRYLRVTNKADFAVGQFSISDLRIFGHAKGKTPNAVKGFQAVRQADRRRIAMSWEPEKDAVGYIIRWGATKDRMEHASQVYTTNVDYGFFDSEQTYYVTVQPFNEVGLGKPSEVVELN